MHTYIRMMTMEMSPVTAITTEGPTFLGQQKILDGVESTVIGNMKLRGFSIVSGFSVHNYTLRSSLLSISC